MSLRGFRDRIASYVLGTNRQGKPVIQTEYGPLDERARLQAAKNMRDDPVKRMEVEQYFVRRYGSHARGVAECKRRYAEAYTDKELRDA